MSYEKVKSIRVKKDGSISVTAASNNVFPITYETCEFKGTMAELLEQINSGNLRLNNNKSNYKYMKVASAIDYIVRQLLDTTEGLGFEDQIHYRLDDREKIIKVICEHYAERILNNDFSDGTGFGRKLGEIIEPMIYEGKKNYERRVKQDESEGVIRMDCAAWSIFEGYDLLHPYGKNEGFLLAPKEDYKGGVLRTDPKNIIPLGPESEELYGFLSFEGINISEEDYAANYKVDPELIAGKFRMVDAIVKKAWEAGAYLRAGVEPYKGFTVKNVA